MHTRVCVKFVYEEELPASRVSNGYMVNYRSCVIVTLFHWC